MPEPFFSVLVTTYNRAALIRRCVDSALAQTFADLEVVVVDDGSTDNTPEVLAGLNDPRLRFVSHETNRGISPARRTAVEHARGEWLVICDSDWELFPHTLQRFSEILQQMPPGVRILRSRMVWDDGRITPSEVPSGATDYIGRIQWRERLAERDDYETDAAYCVHRSVFEHTPFYRDRRGAMETLWELDLARHERSYYVTEVLLRGHVDAPNSHLRDHRPDVVPRLLDEAPDVLWMAETSLAEHGSALERYGPMQRRVLVRAAAVQSFLTAQRRKGIHYVRESLRHDRSDPLTWGGLVLGILGPRAVASGIVLQRRLAARARERSR